MKKESLYTLIIAILLILNLFQLGAFLFAPKPPHHNGGFRDRAVEILNLNENQKQAFFISAQKHKEAIDDLVNEQKKLTISYFNNPSDALLNSIKEIEIEKIEVTQTNFNEIESLLTQEQKPKFEEFKKQALLLIIR